MFYNCSFSLKISFTSKIFHFRFNGSFLPRLTSKMTSTDLVTSFLTFVWWFDLTMILISLYSVSFQFILWCLLLFIVSFSFRALETSNKKCRFQNFFKFPVGLQSLFRRFYDGKAWMSGPESRKFFGPKVVWSVPIFQSTD